MKLSIFVKMRLFMRPTLIFREYKSQFLSAFSLNFDPFLELSLIYLIILLLVLNRTGLFELRYKNFVSKIFFTLDMAVRLNPCEFHKGDVDIFLKLCNKNQHDAKVIRHSKINKK